MRNQVVLAALLVLLSSPLVQAETWTEGKDYFSVVPAQPTHVAPGKVEVTEVFSYGCPYCARFNPFMEQLRRTVSANAEFVFVPASFNQAEDWPMFQRAACTAQTLGIFDKTNAAMFDAVWKTGELAISDPKNTQLKSRLPTIEDAARFYNRISGIAADKFIAASNSFSVDVKMRTDDSLMVAYHADGTPTLIVNGKYRISVESAARSMPRMIEIAEWLVAKESKLTLKSGK
jgi:protein dithiol oxidoreductase (disulfide-forming)